MKPGSTEGSISLLSIAHRLDGRIRSWATFNSRITPIAAIAAGIWLLTFIPGLFGGVGAWIVRAACIALWSWLAVILASSSSKQPALAAPLFLIVTSALWFYAVIPVVFSVAVVGTTSSMVKFISSSTLPQLFPRLIDSEGEMSVLRFALAGIAIMPWAAPMETNARKSNGVDLISLPSRWMILGVGIGATAIYWTVGHMPTDPAGGILKELVRQFRFASLVILLLAIALATIRVAVRFSGAFFDFIALVLAAAVVSQAGGLKTVVFILGVAAIVIALARRSLLVAGAVLIVPLMVFSLGMTVRYAPSIGGEDYYLARVMTAKIVVRQVESVDCLTGVIRETEGAHARSSNAFYFASGLVPSVLWPGKPNLSQSGKTVAHYCDPAIELAAATTGHSASGTLLWEPLVLGGLGGQIAAQALGFIILAGLSRVWITGSSHAAAGVLALTPWSIDFDQHFALYIANLAKAGLVVGASLLLLRWGAHLDRNRPRPLS